jgi:phage portal protein BeeE
MIPQKDADELKERWEQNYGAQNTGRVAVLGGGLSYQPMSVNAHDAQLIEQSKWSAETVCSCFHVPSYMIGIGNPPNYNNIEALNQQYYTQCLQGPIENIELLLDEGLNLTDVGGGKTYGIEFDLDDLLRMDTKTKIEAAVAGRQGGIYTHNEARRKFDLRAVEGGDVPFGQQQDFPISVLANRSGPDMPIGPVPSTPPVAEPDGGKSVTVDRRFFSLALLDDWMTRGSVHARNTGP